MVESRDSDIKNAMSSRFTQAHTWDVDLSIEQVPQLIACRSCSPNEGNDARDTAKNNRLDYDEADVLFVIDGSGSMNGAFGAQTKLKAADGALSKLLPRLTSANNPGLRVFGVEGLYWQYNEQGNLSHLSRIGINPQKEPCEQSSLLVPLTSERRKIGMIGQALNHLSAEGEQTPLQYAIEQAEHDLYGANSNKGKAKVLVLITDGGESCGGDPCEFVKEMRKRHKDLRIDVIGLAVEDQEVKQMAAIGQAAMGAKAASELDKARRQLRCIAEEGGGKYWDVHSEEELVSSLISTVKTQVKGKLLNESKMRSEPGN